MKTPQFSDDQIEVIEWLLAQVSWMPNDSSLYDKIKKLRFEIEFLKTERKRKKENPT